MNLNKVIFSGNPEIKNELSKNNKLEEKIKTESFTVYE